MTEFPLRFEVSSYAEEGTNKEWSSQAPNLEPIKSSVPPEFQGPGTGYTPESLLGIAMLNCIITLIKIYAEKQNVHFESISAHGSVSLDKQSSPPFYTITEIDIKLNVKNPQDQEKIRKLCEKAMKECPIGNAVKTGKTFDLSFS